MAGELIKAGSILKIGQRVEVYVGDDDDKYPSRIEDMDGGDLFIAMPVNSKGVPVIPLTGEKLYVLAVGDQCRYRFFSSYRGRERLDGHLAVWKIACPENVERHQNRQFVRVHVTKKLNVSLIDEEGRRQEPMPTTTVDLSGNGVCFISKVPIRIGCQMGLELYGVDEAAAIDVMGRVVRCTEVDLPHGEKIYHVGAGFEHLSRVIMNKIVRYLFTVQRKNIAKGINL